MKKLFKALLVVALTVAMVLPVFAAPSPQADPQVAKDNATVMVENAEVKVLEEKVHKEIVATVTSKTFMEKLDVKPTAKLKAAFDLKIEIPAGQTSVSVPIQVHEAKVGDYAIILHQKADGQWEKVGEGRLGTDMIVIGTFTSFSPVAILIVEAAQADAGVKAPKTGEF